MSQVRDLRSFLTFVRDTAPREFLRVEHEVSPDWEMAAVIGKLTAAMRAPVVEFCAVRGTTWPVVTNVCASLPRIARAMGWTLDELNHRLGVAYDRPIPPQPWTGSQPAPVRERVMRGGDVDLSVLPRIRYTEPETAPYLTATAVIARHPDSGIPNVSYHRLMIVDHRTTAIYMNPSGHLAQIVAANAAHDRPTPIVAFAGSHPLWSLGSLAAGGLDVDELSVIGGLLGQGLEVVNAEIDDHLPVPARAELALEGVIHPDRLVNEGPFGEFAGYVMPKSRRPVFEVSVFSHRTDPIFQDIVAGSLEQLTISGAALRAHLERSLVNETAGIVGLHLPAPMTVFLTVDTEKLGATTVPQLIRRILASQPYLKQVYCFDPDIDLKSASRTQWALATRMQPDRDLVILRDLVGTDMDPSEVAGTTSKLGVDATAKPTLREFAPVNRVPQAVDDRIDLKSLTRPRHPPN